MTSSKRTTIRELSLTYSNIVIFLKIEAAELGLFNSLNLIGDTMLISQLCKLPILIFFTTFVALNLNPTALSLCFLFPYKSKCYYTVVMQTIKPGHSCSQ